MELLLLLVLADTPFALAESINERFENLVDSRVKSGHGVLRDLTEQNLVVIGTFGVDSLIGVSSHEVDTFAAQLGVAAVGDLEFRGRGNVLDLASLIVDTIRFLVVEKDVGRTRSFEE